jgi:hypothetical protein
MSKIHWTLALMLIGCSDLAVDDGQTEQPGPAPAKQPHEESAEQDLEEVGYALAKRELPPCNQGRENRLFYTGEEDAFFVCAPATKTWEAVDLHGSDGKPGPAGRDGASCEVSVTGLVKCGASTYQIPPPVGGEQGPQGPAGPVGAAGAKGDPGVAGAAGAKGDRGDTGATGPQGQTGAKGDTGATGPRGETGAEGSDGKNSLVKVVTESAGPNCSAGGQKILSGIDDNGDGALQEAEEDSAAFVCNGVNGTNGVDAFGSLVTVTSEAAGDNCTLGGKRIQSGLDNGDNGGGARNSVLETGEVDSTQYICDGQTNLKVYTADGVPLLKFVAFHDFANTVDSVLMERRHLMVVKHLTQTAYTAYDYGATRIQSAKTSLTLTGGFVSRKVLPPTGQVYFYTNDCTGPGYIETEKSGDIPSLALVHLYRLRPFHFGVSHLNEAEITLPSTVPDWNTGTFLSTFGSTCTAGSFALTGMSRVSEAAQGLFPNTLDAGWYLAE